MKIDSSGFKTTPLPPPGAAPQKPAATPAPTDAVSLSRAAQAQQTGNKPPVDSAKIQEIKTAIAEGRFQINPEAIAEGLIETARELVSSQRKA